MSQLKPIPCFLLAAGRGERMRPLTDDLPKPLLTIQKKIFAGVAFGSAGKGKNSGCRD